jgi:DNA-binding PadR family transcriptional regulator
MSLKHAILVSLAERPASGYDLVSRFDRSIGYFWRASHQQMYRELPKLEAAGWVSAEAVAQSGKPDKRVYAITDAGRGALTEWLKAPVGPEPVRESLMVKVRGAALLGAAHVLPEIRRHRQLHADKLTLFQQIEQGDFSNGPGDDPTRRCRYLALRSGVLYHHSWVTWCDEALALLNTG